MATARAADERTLQLLRELRDQGKLSHAEVDDDTARLLLRTPRVGCGAGGEGEGMGASMLATSALASQYGVSGLNPTVGHGSVASTLAKLEDECTAVTNAVTTNVKLTKDQMQRSIGQLIEDTLREKFDEIAAAKGLTASNFGGGGGLGMSVNGLPPLLRGGPGGGSPASMRPMDRSISMPHGAGASKVERSRLSDVVISDATRKQISSELSTALEHELRKLCTVTLSDVHKVSQLVSNLSVRMSAAEEAVLTARVEVAVSEERYATIVAKSEELEKELARVKQCLLDKDKQSDILREQIARRNTTLDDLRVRFQKEVMRYKARIMELEMELEARAISGGGAVSRMRSAMAAGSTLFGDDGPDAADGFSGGGLDVTPTAIEAAVRQATAHLQEQLRQEKVDHAKETKKMQAEFNARIAERDFEIIRSKQQQRSTPAVDKPFAASPSNPS